MAGRTRSRARSAAENAHADRIAPTMAELVERFGTEEACEEHLISLKFPGGFSCPRCGCRTEHRIAGRREHQCTRCGWQFSATSGTTLAHTRVPLAKWFQVGWQLVHGKRGLSAMEAAEIAGVSDRCAGHMPRRMRGAMAWSQMLARACGRVEVDEGYVSAGGDGGSFGRGTSDAPFVVAVSPSVMAVRAVSDTNGGTYREFARWHVSRAADVSADGWAGVAAGMAGWEGLSRRGDGPAGALPAAHHAISNLKAMVAGTHHGVTAAHLQEYCDQFAWRYNRGDGDAFAELLRDAVRWPHTPKRGLSALMAAQPPGEPVRNRESPHNRRLRGRVVAALGDARSRLVGLMSAIADMRSPADVTHA